MNQAHAPSGDALLNTALAEARRQAGAGDAAGALLTLDRARQKAGNQPTLLFAMANLLRDLGQLPGALEIYRQAELTAPHDPALLNNMADVLCALKDFAKARAKIAAARQRDPNNADLLLTVANIEHAAGDLTAAEAALAEALKHRPDYGRAMLNLAEVLADKGDLVGSLNWQRKARERLGDEPRLLFNLSQTLFRTGALTEAWPMYEARFAHAPGEKPRSVPRTCRQPRWDGASASDKKLLVWMEQGVGEEILYAALLPEARQRCRELVVECEPRLVPLFTRSFPDITFFPRSVPPRAEPEAADLQIPAASLGQYFRATYRDFPPHHGYLQADAARAGQLRQGYRALGKGPVIGVSWRSKPRAYTDPKSIPIAAWGPVLSRQDAVFVNLQYGDCVQELEFCAKQGWRLQHDNTIDPMQDLDGFAAQVAACDHVITVSNTTAHMAGALNVPAGVLVPAGKDAPHHWFERGSKSPWYPSLTLWWQTVPCKWDDVIAAVVAAVKPTSPY